MNLARRWSSRFESRSRTKSPFDFLYTGRKDISYHGKTSLVVELVAEILDACLIVFELAPDFRGLSALDVEVRLAPEWRKRRRFVSVAAARALNRGKRSWRVKMVAVEAAVHDRIRAYQSVHFVFASFELNFENEIWL